MSSISDITIIGGGIIGLLSAREFLLAGASVTLIDKNQPGRESSWAGGGILLPLYPWRQEDAISRLVIPSLKMYPSLARELTEQTGIDPEWDPCGLLISNNPDVDQAISWCHARQIPVEPCSKQQLVAFNVESENPLWLPGIAHARNPRLIKALIKYLEDRRVRFISETQLQEVEIDKHRVQSITTTSGKHAVNQLLLSAGAWSGELWQRFFADTDACPPRITPIKGQMLLFDGPPGLLPHIILDQDRYLIPRRDGKILAGSTVEHQGFDKQTTQQAREQLSHFANKLFPALAKIPLINHWAGVRPGTDHGIPYIDIHPEIENLSINAGHFRNGLCMGPASAKLLVDLINRRPPLLPAEPYQLTARH